MRWLIVGLVLALAWVRVAAAQERHGVVTIDLREDPGAAGSRTGEMPTHLCVVSESKSGRARDRLWDLLEPEPERVGTAGASQSTYWRVRPKAWDGAEGSADHQRCAEGPVGDCRPRVELPAALSKANEFYAACTFDSLADGGSTEDPRPLFVLLEHLEGPPPTIESVRLAGGVATIGVDADLDRVVVTARSLGGAYLPHRRSERGKKESSGEGGSNMAHGVLVELPLKPRCRVVELTLPRTTVSPEDRKRLRVSAHGVDLDVDKCVGALSGTDVLQVRLPQAPLGVGSVDVELVARGGRPGAQFGGRYDGDWPRAPFALRFKQVTFNWRRPSCIYPTDRCPTATLETGTVCTASPTKTGCQYRCPGTVDDTAIDLDLPLDVTFEKDAPIQRWQDTLARSGQTLSSYVGADEIYLDANVNDWDTDIPDNQINAVEVFGEDGEVRKYGVTHVPNLQLNVPGASCEPVRFKPVGDRQYEEAIANVADGKLEFGKPQRTARRVGFNVMLAVGGGPAWSTNIGTSVSPRLYFSGLGMFAIEIRGRQPKASRWAFEARLGGTLGRYGTVVLQSDTVDPNAPATTTTTGNRDAGWARILVEPGVVYSAHNRVAIGLGAGVGVGLPFRSGRDLVSSSVNAIVSPNIDLRFRVRRYLKVVLQLRGVLHEQPLVRGSGQQPSKSDWSGSLMTLFGLQAAF